MASQYFNGMGNIPGFTKRPDGSYYNPKTGEVYNTSNGSVSLTNNNGTNVVKTTDTTQEYAPPVPKGLVYNKTPTQTTPNWYNPQTYIDNVNSQFEAQKASNLSALRQAYDKQRADYNAMLPSIEQNAQNDLNSNDAAYYNTAIPQLRAAMEASGNYGGGEMLGQNVNLIAMRGNNANAINVSKNNQIQNIKNALAQIDSEQPLKEAELQNSLSAQQAAATLQAIQTGLAAQNQQYNQNMQTQQYNDAQTDKLKQSFLDTIGQYSGDFQAQVNKITNDGDPSNDWQIAYLQAARQQKIQNQKNAEIAAAKVKSEQDQQTFKNALDAWKISGIATSSIASILGVPVGAKSADYDLARINASISAQNANTSAMNAQTSRTNSTNAQAQRIYANSSAKVKQYADQIDNMYSGNSYNADGQNIGNSYDADKIKEYIRTLNTKKYITDDEARQLMSLYGFYEG